MTDETRTKSCQHCQGGRQYLRTATLMTWLGNDLITVPNFPAWICDLCGYRTYDSHALTQLSLLLNAEAGSPIETNIKPSEKQPPLSTAPPA